MRQRAGAGRRMGRSRRGRRTPEELLPESAPASPSPTTQERRNGPLYQAGPVFGMPSSQPEPEEAQEDGAAAPQSAQEPEPETASAPEQADLEQPILTGEGEPTHAVDFQRGRPLRLRGRTNATFDGGSFTTENLTITPATGCRGCRRRACVHVTGTLVATYSVRTRVTLPRASDFRGLTDCQRQRVQDAIDNILAPHEQDHVQAFETYNGTTSTPIDLTICRNRVDAAIAAMFRAEERARRQAARAASAALDPFNFDVDLDCEDRTSSLELDQPAGATPPTEEEALV